MNQLAAPYGPERMIYGVRGAGGTNIGGESHGGRHYKVDLRSGDCTCMTPQLLHLPCSHLITACRARRLESVLESVLRSVEHNQNMGA